MHDFCRSSFFSTVVVEWWALGTWISEWLVEGFLRSRGRAADDVPWECLVACCEPTAGGGTRYHLPAFYGSAQPSATFFLFIWIMLLYIINVLLHMPDIKILGQILIYLFIFSSNLTSLGCIYKVMFYFITLLYCGCKKYHIAIQFNNKFLL